MQGGDGSGPHSGPFAPVAMQTQPFRDILDQAADAMAHRVGEYQPYGVRKARDADLGEQLRRQLRAAAKAAQESDDD